MPTPYTKNSTRNAFYFNGTAYVEQRVWSRTVSGYKQPRPYVIDTPCTIETLQVTSGGNVFDKFAPDDYSPIARISTQAENQCYNELVSQLGDASQFGSTLTSELKSTWGTVVQSLTTLLKGTRQFVKGDIFGAAKTFGVGYSERVVTRYGKKVYYEINRRGKVVRRVRRRVKSTRTYIRLPTGREVLKDSASKWLWYSYGVKPLCQDVYNGLDILQRPIPVWKWVYGKGRGSWSNPGSPYYHEISVSYKAKAMVTVDNPNLYLASRLGLVNPAQWALEGIPFSFVLDWFSNLSNVVNSLTDFVGLRVERPSLTRLYIDNVSVMPDHSARRTLFSRRQALPTVKLQFAYERFSWQRGANAISLLLGFLPKR